MRTVLHAQVKTHLRALRNHDDRGSFELLSQAVPLTDHEPLTMGLETLLTFTEDNVKTTV